MIARLLAMLLLASAAPALAAPSDGLRGDPSIAATAQGATARPGAITIPAKPFVAPVRAPDPALASPGLLRPAAPRVKGWADAGSGGSRCRGACAKDQYFCLAQDGGDCSAQWLKCVAACSGTSADN